MKVVFILILALATSVCAKYMTNEVKYADNTFMLKQRIIFEIFMHVLQPELHNHYYEDAHKVKLEGLKEKITNAEAYDNFMVCYHTGFLNMHYVFAPMQTEQNEQMLAVFKMLYYAKDWETFYNMMVWSRFNINSGMFIQALTMAILHRDDMAGIVLPPIYEVNPYHFFSGVPIRVAQQMKLRGLKMMQKDGDSYKYTIVSNNSDFYVALNEDSRLAYFMEDIGLNSYYYYWNLDYNSYLGGDEFGLNKDRRGEFYMYQIRQILARYYLERLSNGLGEIPTINYWSPLETGALSCLSFYNGINFPSRTNYYMMHLYKGNTVYLDHMYAYERRVFDAIDSGFLLLPNGEKMAINKPESIEHLGNLIQMNKDSMGNFYYYGMLEKLGRKLLGGSLSPMDSYLQIPSVLELFETAMRDPMFYIFYKRLNYFYDAFITKMPQHKKTDLMMDGVKFTEIEIDKLITFFEHFEADITNAVDIDVDLDHSKCNTEFKIKVPRLNHLPFNVKMHINSNKEQKVVVMMFVGPKYDSMGHEMSINENRNNFWELDRWTIDLKTGDSIYERKSTDFTWFVNDRTTFYELYKNLMTAIDGKGKFPLDMSEAHCGFPSRLMLPRGRVGGFAVQFFFMVMPFNAPNVARFTDFDPTISCGVGSGNRYLDATPFGYPFNRQFEENNYMTPNMYFYDTFIHHKLNNDIKPYF